jgi:transcription initiation factor IIE alpha subunit
VPSSLERAKELLQTTVRMFYESRHAVVLDYVITMSLLSDDGLAERMHCQQKDAHRLMAVLRDDRLIRTESRVETRGIDAKPLTRTYMYIDYKQAVRTIKWRLERMREASEARLRADLEKRGYKCRQCGRHWSPLDVHTLHCGADGFLCDICGLVLDLDEDNLSANKKPQELHVQLMECVAPLVHILRQIKMEELPIVNPSDLISKQKKEVVLSGMASSSSDDKASDLSLPGKLDIGVVVELPEEAEKEANQKREAPHWYTHSTVTGERLDGKSLGIEEPPMKKSKSVEIVFDDAGDLQQDNQENPIVKVRGIEKLFSEVTEEDKRMMTSEEYEEYFEHFLRIQGQ